MVCNVENMLANAAFECPSYAADLNCLGRNLRELWARHRAGDATAIEEFFSIYVVESPLTPTPKGA